MSVKIRDYKNYKKIKVIQFEQRNLKTFMNHAFRELIDSVDCRAGIYYGDRR